MDCFAERAFAKGIWHEVMRPLYFLFAIAITLAVPANAAGVQKWRQLLDRINSPQGESWLSIHPSGALALYDQHDDGFGNHRIYVVEYLNGAWQTPQLAPFAQGVDERGARFSPDGRTVVFSSTRSSPIAGEEEGDWNIWIVTYLGGGEWEAPVMLPAPVNSAAPEIHPSVDASDRLYFSSCREDGAGASDMYTAEVDNGVWTVRPLSAFNTPASEPDPYIFPDSDILVFARTDGPGGYGGDDLYGAKRVEEGWSAPVNLGPEVNTTEYEYGASLSPDGTVLFYTTFAPGHADIKMIKLSEIKFD